MHIKPFSHEKNLELPAVGPSRLTLCSADKIPDAVPATRVWRPQVGGTPGRCVHGERARPAQPYHLKALNSLFGMLISYAFCL